MRVDPSSPRGTSSVDVPPPPFSTSADAAETSVVGHVLIYPIFIHRILLFLGLANFPSGEPIHVVAPLGATFLRQRATHLGVDLLGPRGASSGDVPPPPSSTSADVAETSGAVATTNVPPPTTSDDSDIQRTLDHVLTV